MVEFIGPAMVEAITERIRAAQDEMRDTASRVPRPSRWRENDWMDASRFLVAFPNLSLAEGHTLVCVYSRDADERQSRLLVRHGLASLGEIPETLADLSMSPFFRNDDLSVLPKDIDPDVLEYVRDDGTGAGLFERSVFARWVPEVMNFGHGVWWGRHDIITSGADSVVAAPAGRKQPWKRKPGADWPDEWRPLVIRSEIFDVVRFYSATAYNGESLFRNTDWYAGGRLIASENIEIATGGAGYMV